jgi:hypothetical protein
VSEEEKKCEKCGCTKATIQQMHGRAAYVFDKTCFGDYTEPGGCTIRALKKRVKEVEAERDAAIKRAEVAEAALVKQVSNALDVVANLEAERDEALKRAEKVEATVAAVREAWALNDGGARLEDIILSDTTDAAVRHRARIEAEVLETMAKACDIRAVDARKRAERGIEGFDATWNRGAWKAWEDAAGHLRAEATRREGGGT